jgi:hypothetical protein
MAELDDLTDHMAKRRYYRVEDLKGKGFVGKVCDITMETMGDKEKVVTWFENHELGVVSEGRRIADLADIAGSPKKNDIIGTTVKVSVEKVKGKSGSVDSITFSRAEGDAIPF